MALVSRIQAYKRHDLWDNVRSVLELIESAEPENDQDSERLSEIQAVLEAVLALQSDFSPLVTQRALDELNRAVEVEVLGHLKTWSGTNESTYLATALNGVDQVADLAIKWPTTKDKKTRELTVTLQQVSNEMMTREESLVALSEELSGDFKSVSNQAAARISELEESFRENLGTLSGQIEQAQASLQMLDNESEQLKARNDLIVNEQQETFNNAEQTRLANHQEHLEKERLDFDESLREAIEISRATLSDQQAAGEELLAKLHRLEEQAKALVEATADASTTTDFGRYSDQQRRTADWLRLAAIACFLSAFVFGAATLFLLDFEQSNNAEIIIKGSISVALIAAAGYLIKESARHRENEFESKATQLKILSLGPYVANMPDSQQEYMRLQMARYIFLDSDEKDLDKTLLAFGEGVDQKS